MDNSDLPQRPYLMAVGGSPNPPSIFSFRYNFNKYDSSFDRNAAPCIVCFRATSAMVGTIGAGVVREAALARGCELHPCNGHQRTRNVAGGLIRSEADRHRVRVG